SSLQGPILTKCRGPPGKIPVRTSQAMTTYITFITLSEGTRSLTSGHGRLHEHDSPSERPYRRRTVSGIHRLWHNRHAPEHPRDDRNRHRCEARLHRTARRRGSLQPATWHRRGLLRLSAGRDALRYHARRGQRPGNAWHGVPHRRGRDWFALYPGDASTSLA